jgi:hypothetical protein
MAEQPAEPSSLEPAPGEDPGEGAGAKGQPSQEAGPIAIERLTKADGRALILYTTAAATSETP